MVEVEVKLRASIAKIVHRGVQHNYVIVEVFVKS